MMSEDQEAAVVVCMGGLWCRGILDHLLDYGYLVDFCPFDLGN